MRVTADDRRHVERVEEERDPLLGRALGEDVDVVPRRGVAVEDVADPGSRRVRKEEVDLLLRQRCARRVERARGSKAGLARIELSVGGSSIKLDGVSVSVNEGALQVT